MRAPRLQTNPALIRAVLLDAERNGPIAACRRAQVSTHALYRWKEIAASLPDWPNDQDVAQWRAREPRRRRDTLTRLRRWKAAGPLLVDATGTQRRVRALYAQGFTYKVLAREYGASPAAVQRFTHEDLALVNVRTRDRWAEIFDRIAAVVPSGWTAERARRIALRHGWPRPMVWDNIDDPAETPATVTTLEPADDDIDPMVIERILAGDRMPATRAERVESVRRWAALGRPLRQLELAQGWKVDRYLKREAIAS